MREEADDDRGGEGRRAEREIAGGARPHDERRTHEHGMPPTAMPNIVTDTATKAKWYDIVTLKMRVSSS